MGVPPHWTIVPMWFIHRPAPTSSCGDHENLGTISLKQPLTNKDQLKRRSEQAWRKAPRHISLVERLPRLGYDRIRVWLASGCVSLSPPTSFSRSACFVLFCNCHASGFAEMVDLICFGVVLWGWLGAHQHIGCLFSCEMRKQDHRVGAALYGYICMATCSDGLLFV